MLQGILNTLAPTPRFTPLCFAAAGVILGHKVALAAGCKVGAVYAEHMGQTNVDEWNQASNNYLLQAKKDAVRDLTLATAIAGLGLTAGYLRDYLTEKPDNIYTYAEKMMKNIEAEVLSNPLTVQFFGQSVITYLLYKTLKAPKIGTLYGIASALDLIYRATKASLKAT